MGQGVTNRTAMSETPAPLSHIVPNPRPHSWPEDLYAIILGASFIALGLALLHHANLVTGGMAGVALLLSYFVPIAPGTLFTLVNLPFFLLAWRWMGSSFAIKTIIANIAITLMSAGMPHVLAIGWLSPLYAAIFGGTIIGFGILALARHGAGVGGIGVVALGLHRSRNWNAGRTQLIADAFILAASIPVLEPNRFLLSALSALAISLVLIVNHRPGRYVGY
jgi:uncharacterized membrane-anchored protein YitT (DUF2179 family)